MINSLEILNIYNNLIPNKDIISSVPLLKNKLYNNKIIDYSFTQSNLCSDLFSEIKIYTGNNIITISSSDIDLNIIDTNKFHKFIGREILYIKYINRYTSLEEDNNLNNDIIYINSKYTID